MSTYENYKSVDSFWFKKIPSHWKVTKNKFVFSEDKKVVGENWKEYTLLTMGKSGVKPRDMDGGGKFPESFENYQTVTPGQIIFCLFDIDETPRTVGLSKNHGMITSAYNVFSVNAENDPKYWTYFYQMIDDHKGLRPFYTGLRKVVRSDTFMAIEVFLPPINEQQLISQYLDKKTQHIDLLIGKIQKRIELLKEQRNSIINQCVTKGLNRNVVMKNTGVDWIGEIPQHWELSPMFTLFNENKDKNKEGSLEVLTLSYGKIKYRDLSKLEGLYPDSFDGYQMVDVNTIIIRSTDLQNDHKSLRVGYVGLKGVITSAYLGLNPKNFANTKFYYYSIHLADLKKVLYGLGGGLRQSLRFDDFKWFPIITPPLDEQNEISKHLDNIDSKTELIVEKLEKRLVLLNEYRHSLISTVVTGEFLITEDMV